MILFTILLVMLLTLAIAFVFTTLVGGTVIVAMFGDLIIFALLIAVIVKLIRKFRKKK